MHVWEENKKGAKNLFRNKKNQLRFPVNFDRYLNEATTAALMGQVTWVCSLENNTLRYE